MMNDDLRVCPDCLERTRRQHRRIDLNYPAMFRVEQSRIEDFLGHATYCCERCGSRYKLKALDHAAVRVAER